MSKWSSGKTAKTPARKLCGCGSEVSVGRFDVCDECDDIANTERWLGSERRQIEADQFSLDMRIREYQRQLETHKEKVSDRAYRVKAGK